MEKSKIAEWELQGDFGIITIDNPPQNYLDEPEFVYLSDLKRWTSNDSLKGIIITGKGRHFCAGANQQNIFKVMSEEEIQETLRKGKAIFEYLDHLPIPVVAAIKGVCLGGGLELALSCHVRICGDKSLFSFPETGLNVMPGLAGTVVLPGKIGMFNSLDLVLTSKMIDASEALRLQLVDYVVPTKEVFDFSLQFLQKITRDRPISVIHAVVKSLNNARRLSTSDAIDEGIKMFCKLTVEASHKRRQE